MTISVCINGNIVGEKDAAISVFDRGFLYGDSVYEVMRTYEKRPFALDDHIDRLEYSARILEIAFPIKRQRLIQAIFDTLEHANNLESYLRIIITRGSGKIGLDPALAIDPSWVIIVTPLQTIEEKLYEKGVRVSLVTIGRNANNLQAGAKSGNYLTNLLALRHAKSKGAHEAILVDSEGQICEGSTSNVFAFIDNQIVTPPLNAGILEGITRKKTMHIAQKIGYTPIEKHLSPDQLKQASEVFITSTIREILPVVQIDDYPVGNGSVGPLAKSLRDAFIRSTQ